MKPEYTDDNPPAFPRNYDADGHNGISLRDYFAAKAMEGSRSRESTYSSWSDLAKDSYEIADAMLAARKQ